MTHDPSNLFLALMFGAVLGVVGMQNPQAVPAMGLALAGFVAVATLLK